jgi:hypothetical protein
MRPVPILVAFLCAGVVIGAAGTEPYTFPKSAPEAQGISSAAILGFLDEAEQKLDALHSIMVVRHGKAVAEGWWAPYAADEPHMMFLILPQYDVVVAITSGTRDMGSVMNLIWDRLVPALKEGALAADAASYRKLTTKLASLTLRPQTGTAAGVSTKGVEGKRYVFGANPLSIESLTLASTGETGEATFTVRTAGSDQQVVAAPGAWRKGTILVKGTPDPIAASGAWTSDDTYTLQVVRYQTPFATTYRLRFAGDQLVVDSEQNVGAPDARMAHVEGKLDPGPSGSKE